jgi:hypothetical protein
MPGFKEPDIDGVMVDKEFKAEFIQITQAIGRDR